MDVFVANYDNGLAGTYLLDAFRNTPPGNQTLNWIFTESSRDTLLDRIENGKAWGLVYMNAGTSDRLNQIIQSILDGNSSSVSYVPSSATTIVYDQGRNLNTVNGYVLPPIRTAIAVASTRYASYIQSQAVRYANATVGNVITAIELTNVTYAPIGSTSINLHPAVPYVSFLATSLGYLFLWLTMTSLVVMGLRITQPLAGKVKIIDIVIIRTCNALFNGLIVSLIYSLVVLWFADFNQAAPFIRFWLFNWLATITFSIIIALFITNLGPLAQIALVLFLITNLASSSSNLAIELQNPFYRIGYGLPLLHCFSGGRHLLFGSHTRLNVDIAVLFAYYFAALILILITGIYRMRKQQASVIEESRKKATKTTQSMNGKKV